MSCKNVTIDTLGSPEDDQIVRRQVVDRSRRKYFTHLLFLFYDVKQII